MNLTAVIAPVLGIVASTSAGIAVENLVKMATPVGLKTMQSFGLRIGTAVTGGLIGAKVASVVVENVESVIATVNAEEVHESDTDNEEEN